MKRFVRSWRLTLPVFVAALFVMFPVTANMAATILSSNMNVEATGNTGITNAQWTAAPFRTTSGLTRLTDVNLDVFDNGQYAGGDLSVEIWTASNAGPTAFMQSILKSSFASTPVSITGLSVMLQPDTDYFVVARGDTFNDVPDPEGLSPGALSWNGVSTTTHTGNGFVGGSWASVNSGSSWDYHYTNTTLKMSVLAAPSGVPEIDPATGSIALCLVAGVIAMIEQRRQRATLVA